MTFSLKVIWEMDEEIVDFGTDEMQTSSAGENEAIWFGEHGPVSAELEAELTPAGIEFRFCHTADEFL